MAEVFGAGAKYLCDITIVLKVSTCLTTNMACHIIFHKNTLRLSFGNKNSPSAIYAYE